VSNDSPDGSGRAGTPRPDADDPDAEGLPPHVALPPKLPFMRSQFRARAVLCAVALVIVSGFWYANRQTSIIFPLCFGLVAVMLVITLIRLWRVGQLIARDEQMDQDRAKHD